MKYVAANPLIRGGFGHNLHFKWDSLPQDKVLKHRLDPSLPIRTPAIAGGLFAVDRAYFERIGLYDDQMDIWGGENVGEGPYQFVCLHLLVSCLWYSPQANFVVTFCLAGAHIGTGIVEETRPNPFSVVELSCCLHAKCSLPLSDLPAPSRKSFHLVL